jgi:putative phosphoesterase
MGDGMVSVEAPPGTAVHPGPLRVGLISDTHIPESRPELWPEVFEAFAGVDLILHGGDLHELSVLRALEEVAPVYAARGNGEDGSAGRPITPEDPQLKLGWVLDLGGVRVGLTHDLPLPQRPPNLTVERWCQRRFGTTDVDLIVHGHTHVEAFDVVDDVLCVNPGSPTYPRNLQTQLGTIGMLDVHQGSAAVALFQLTSDGPLPHPRLEPVTHTARVPR